MSYFSEKDNSKSSMRLGYLVAIFASALLLLVVSIYILIMAVKYGGVNDWTGLGVFTLGILGGLTGMGFAKAQQKKFENGKNRNDI